nr:hypothetical protein [Tanacetum cinerariifolium]
KRRNGREPSKDRNRSIKKNPEKRGNRGELSKDRNGRDDKKRTITENAFAMTANPVRGGYTGTAPKYTTCSDHHPPETHCHSCFNCNRLRHFAKDCRVMPRNVNPINARNPVTRTCFKCGSNDHIRVQGRRNQGNHARVRAFMKGVEEARQDPNIMTSTFTLNCHYATTLFDSGAEYSFVSTTFLPLLDIEPSDLGFSYEIKIASGKLVEIDKVINGYKLEIEGHVFDINLLPFRSESFDVIIGMDWVSDHKARIICHENVVRIPLLDGKGRRNQGNHARVRAFMKGVEEARQDPNIMTNIEPSDLGFSYEIKIASGKLVEIDKVIKGYKLEIEGHVFDINLLPFRTESFDVIIGMDWVSDHKARIICHEKVVRIPLLDGK